MKVLLLTVAAVVGVVSAGYTPPTPSSFVSCAEKVKCAVYMKDPKIKQIIARCKPNYPGSQTPCTPEYCCAVPVTPPVPCDPTVKCEYGYAVAGSKCTVGDQLTPCTEPYCCKPAPAVKCAVKFACQWGYLNEFCPVSYSSSTVCPYDKCCKPEPPAKLTPCDLNGVTCTKYRKDPKTHGIMRCKKVTWTTTMPCTKPYCCEKGYY